MPIIIKGKLIDATSPKICVPIVERTEDEILAAATKLTLKHVEMVEWRADFFEDLFDDEKLLKVLSSLKGLFANTIFLVTVRSAAEGGQVALEEEDMEKLLSTIATSRCADIIDMEYFRYTNPQSLIRLIQNSGAAVIASHHDFKATPSKAVNLRLLSEMEKGDPDIVKLAVMPTDSGDVFEVGAAASAFAKERPDLPLIIIAMGNPGVITRIVPGAFKSCVTFGSVDKASAPGQVDFSVLKEMIEFTGGFYE